jgi:hypothetical protein
MGTSPKKPKKPEPKKPVDQQPDPKEPAPIQAAAKHPPVKTLPAGIPPNISNMFGGKAGKGPRFTPTKGRNFRHQGR